jgi:hypothetical protein
VIETKDITIQILIASDLSREGEMDVLQYMWLPFCPEHGGTGKEDLAKMHETCT